MTVASHPTLRLGPRRVGLSEEERGAQMHREPWVRVFVLGDFVVLRHDGTSIPEHEWRTGKNRDLLRLLALQNGSPVRVAGIIDKLWPDVPEDRARASLRTAVSHLRRVLGPQCISRRDAGLVLAHAWVDAAAFETRATQVHAAWREGDFETALALAEAAEHLYADDFRASNDDSDWAARARAGLVRRRHDLLVDAAEAALELGRFRHALDHARAAVILDATAERAQRALMRAHAELGEVGSALRVFEVYRTSLAEELGIDPSPQTLDLHVQLLRGAGMTSPAATPPRPPGPDSRPRTAPSQDRSPSSVGEIDQGRTDPGHVVEQPVSPQEQQRGRGVHDDPQPPSPRLSDENRAVDFTGPRPRRHPPQRDGL
ncbi:hypothetical protein GCM10027026_40370 [Myroides odoratimimus subsp. xuanwuensis]